MPNKEYDVKDILRLLGSWITEIRLENAISYLDINKVSEGFAMKLLNLLYDYELEDLNKITEKYPGLDLGNFGKSKVAFQVTSRVDTAKVISSLKTITARNDHHIFTGGIKFLILKEGEKVKFPATSNPTNHLSSFNEDTDMVYPEHLAKKVNDIYDSDDFTTFLQIKTLVERELQFITRERPQDIQNAIAALSEQIKQQLAGISGSAQQQQNITFDISVDAEFPDITVRGKRQELSTALYGDLVSARVLWLTGTTGTGKSSLAYLIGQQFTQPKYWVDFREIQLSDIVAHLIASLCNSLQLTPSISLGMLKTIAANVGEGGLIVLNDVPDISSSVKITAIFNALIKAGLEYHINFIFTSNYKPNLSFENEFSGEYKLLSIPLFTLVDTSEVLQAYGAPADIIESYAQTVNALSEGYPLIVNSIASYLKSQHWEIDSNVINNIFSNDYNDQLNHEIYASVIKSTEDADTLNLLYRCRIIIGSFSGDELDIIANVEPHVPNHHQKFERIKGIWIQQTQNGKYQLSPLVRRLGSNINHALDLQINRSLGERIFNKNTLNQLEIIKALQYLINGESFMDAAMMLVAVLNEAIKTPRIFFEWGLNLYWFYEGIPNAVNPETRIYIRFLQINLCILSEENYDDLLRDIKMIMASEDLQPRALGFAHILFFQLLSKTEPVKAMSHLVLAYKYLPINEIFKGKGEDRIEQAIWIPFTACKTEADYLNWFEQIKGLDISKDIYNPKENQAYVAAGLSIYVNLIAEKTVQDLPATRSALLTILELAKKAGLDLLAIYCIRNLIIILCEDLKQFDEAEALVNSQNILINSDPIYKFLVYDELGRQLFFGEHKEKGAIYMKQIVDTELPEFYTEKVTTCRVYSQLIGDELPELALSYSLKALHFVMNNKYFLPLEKIKIFGEAGISYWLTGDLAKSISCFEQGYDLLNKIFDDSPDHQAQVVRYGSTANYIAQILTTGKAPTKSEVGEYSIPKRGSFYFTNDKIHEFKVYYPERRYMAAHLFQVAYEFLGNYETARKWALVCIQIMLQVENPRFAILLHGSLYYLINDREYGKAMNVFNYIKKHYKPNISRIAKNADEEQVLAISQKLNNRDVVFYTFHFIPILFKIIPDIMDGTIREEDDDKLFSELFDVPAHSVSDPDVFSFAEDIVKQAIDHRTDPFDLAQKLEDFNPDYIIEIKVIAYLIAGIHGTAKESANFQLSLVNRLEALYTERYSEIFNLLIIPFFEKFWKSKAELCKDEFYDFEIWNSESIPRFMAEKGVKRIKTLFKTLNYHLELDLPDHVSEWIKSK